MAVEKIEDHDYTGLLHNEAVCEHPYVSGGGHSKCQRPMAQHKFVGRTRLEPHSWLGPASEGGSNELCHVTGCHALRLGKVHAGFKPEFLEVPPVTEELPHDAFTEKMVQEVTGFRPASDAVIAFNAYAEAVLDLVRQKDKAYGGAWRKQGYMGNLSRVLSKVARLENMLWTDDSAGGEMLDDGGEHVLDTLKDLMALCAFTAANIEDGNRWGRG